MQFIRPKDACNNYLIHPCLLLLLLLFGAVVFLLLFVVVVVLHLFIYQDPEIILPYVNVGLQQTKLFVTM